MVKGLPFKSGKLIHLSPFDKDGLIRVGGRIGSGCFPYSSKQQVIISNSHPIAFLLVFYIHVTNFHSGHDLTLILFFFTAILVYEVRLFWAINHNSK